MELFEAIGFPNGVGGAVGDLITTRKEKMKQENKAPLVMADLVLEKIDNGFIAKGNIGVDEVRRHFNTASEVMARLTGEFNRVVEEINRGNSEWSNHPFITVKFSIEDQ